MSQIKVTIPLDENGMLGRECLKCEKYFKLKPGTGLETTHCHCPYCDYEGEMHTFWTKAQLEYAESIAWKEAYNTLIKPALNELARSFKQIERRSRNSLIQLKVKTSNSGFTFPIKYYSENELETNLTCNFCGLEFAIYGVFSTCPDCNEINAFLIYEKSLEVIRKKLDIFMKPEVTDEIRELSFNSVLTSGISAFDGLGKELRKRKPLKYPENPKNLFQNLSLLNSELDFELSKKLSNYSELLKFFQVRHLIEHNMGVIDEDFVKKIPAFQASIGRKYTLDPSELENYLALMKELGNIIQEDFEKEPHG